jgi:hypothetical protein
MFMAYLKSHVSLPSAPNARIALFEPPFPASDRHAVAGAIGAAPAAAGAPKRRRSRAIRLAGVDRRTALGKRIAELTAVYLAALGGADALSPLKRLKVDEAAQLKALAELARGDYMRDAKGCLDDIVRIERKAGAAERALGINEAKAAPVSPLAAHFAKPPA